MNNVTSMEVAHGLRNLLGQVNALLLVKGLGPDVNAFVEGRTTTIAAVKRKGNWTNTDC